MPSEIWLWVIMPIWAMVIKLGFPLTVAPTSVVGVGYRALTAPSFSFIILILSFIVAITNQFASLFINRNNASRCKPHFGVESCPIKLLKQPRGPQNYRISESKMQVTG